MSDLFLLSVCAGAAALGLAATLRWTSPSALAPEMTRWSRWAIALIGGAVAFKFAFIVQSIWQGYVTMWPDEGARLLMNHAFDQDISDALSTNDRVWPVGSHLVSAAAMRMGDDNNAIMHWLASAYAVLSVLSAAWLGREVTGRDSSAVFCAWFVAILPMHSWLSTGAMTEMPTTAFLCLSLACALHGWRRAGEGRRGGPVFLAGAGLFATLASGFRYEGWIWIAAFGALSGLHWLWRTFGARALPAWLQPKQPNPMRSYSVVFWVAGALALAFPVYWMIDSLLHFGHPLAFFKNQTGTHTVGAEWTFWQRLQIFRLPAHAQIGSLWGLFLAGIPIALIRGSRRPLTLFGSLAILAYIGLMIVVTALQSIPSSLERYVISLLVLASPIASMAVAVGEDAVLATLASRRPTLALRSAGWIASALVLWTLITFGARSAGEAGRYKWWGYDTASFAVGHFLAQEFREPQHLPNLGRGGDVVLHKADHNFAHWWHIALMAGHLDRIRLQGGPDLEERWAQDESITVVRIGDGLSTPPAHLAPVVDFQTVVIYHQAVEE
ncbi:MAG: hypothetical protein RLY93_10020 [Sumerlaeia bacterium]